MIVTADNYVDCSRANEESFAHEKTTSNVLITKIALSHQLTILNIIA